MLSEDAISHPPRRQRQRNPGGLEGVAYSAVRTNNDLHPFPNRVAAVSGVRLVRLAGQEARECYTANLAAYHPTVL